MRNNMLPQIPHGHYNEIPRDGSRNSTRSNGGMVVVNGGKYPDELGGIVLGENGEMTLYNGDKLSSNNVEEMRRNIMKLNSDLLRKSIEISKLEDELREAVRKSDKVKESYR